MIEKYFREIHKIATRKYGGHFCIFSFTTHYKGFYGTLDLDGRGREMLKQASSFKTLNNLLVHMIENPDMHDSYSLHERQGKEF